MNYCTANISNELIKDILRFKEKELKESSVNDASGLIKRNSSISWIKD